MSGGSHNYIYTRIDEELVGSMHDKELDDLMKDISELAHDVEWYDSSDIDENKYKESVKKFKNKWFKSTREERLKGYIDKTIDDLRQELINLIGDGSNSRARIPKHSEQIVLRCDSCGAAIRVGDKYNKLHVKGQKYCFCSFCVGLSECTAKRGDI